jgi:hypothetical protein
MLNSFNDYNYYLNDPNIIIKKESKEENRKEGYWKDTSDTYNNQNAFWHKTYPMPQRNTINQTIKNEFLEKLDSVEKYMIKNKKYSAFMGSSYCRLADYDKCTKKDRNGSIEYVDSSNNWAWPEGYKHYIVEHNVSPTNEFYEYIMSFILF